MEYDLSERNLEYEDYPSSEFIAKQISNNFDVSMRVGKDAALDLKAKGRMSFEEMVHSINKAIVRESLSQLSDQGLLEMVINESGEVEYRPRLRKRRQIGPSIQNE